MDCLLSTNIFVCEACILHITALSVLFMINSHPLSTHDPPMVMLISSINHINCIICFSWLKNNLPSTLDPRPSTLDMLPLTLDPRQQPTLMAVQLQVSMWTYCNWIPVIWYPHVFICTTSKLLCKFWWLSLQCLVQFSQQ